MKTESGRSTSRDWSATEDRTEFVADRARTFLTRRLTVRNTRAWFDATRHRLRPALALVPVVAAHLQFGYAPATAAVDADHGERITRSLNRLGDDAAEAATGGNWSDREAAVQRLRDLLAPRLRTLEQSRLGEGVVVNVSYSGSLARQVDCPAGDGRAFGNCEDVDGVVVQERAGETVVVGIAFEVRVTGEKGTTTFSTFVRPEERRSTLVSSSSGSEGPAGSRGDAKNSNEPGR